MPRMALPARVMPKALSKNLAQASGSRTAIAMWRNLAMVLPVDALVYVRLSSVYQIVKVHCGRYDGPAALRDAGRADHQGEDQTRRAARRARSGRALRGFPN